MKRTEYIRSLMIYFKGPFLEALGNADQNLIGVVKKCYCEVSTGEGGVSVTFLLANFFNALWLSASESGVPLPANSQWGKDFNEFCRQLMFPWPDKELLLAGFSISLVETRRSRAACKYKLSTLAVSNLPRKIED